MAEADAVSAPKRTSKLRTQPKVSIRVPAYSYISAVFVGSFFSALLFYLDRPWIGTLLFLISWTVIPSFALTDRLVFNGKRVHRSGLLPKMWAYMFGSRFWLKVRDIEQIETRIFPTLKRGGRIFFRYNTLIRGKGLEFEISSAGRDYRRFTRTLFSQVPPEILDGGSVEVRDYARDPGKTRRLAKNSSIPASDVLEHALRTDLRGGRRRKPDDGRSPDVSVKADTLRELGNRLRFSGSLLQALESFRRAARLQPDNAWLLFDFARCIRVFAGSEKNASLDRKASAMMRLAEQRAGKDGELLARLGESYFQAGEWERAANAFKKAIDAVGEQFRSIRGMAEIALRDGKLAHVVHNFSAASRLAESPAARRWSEAEAEYFSRLNNDDEYMDMELGRVNLLDALHRWKGMTLRLCLIGFPIIALGLFFNDAMVANAGWILSGGMITLWAAIRLATRVFAPRIAPELLQED